MVWAGQRNGMHYVSNGRTERNRCAGIRDNVYQSVRRLALQGECRMVSRLMQRQIIRIAAKLLQIVSLFVTGGTCVCADVTNTVVFKSGQDSYHTYRIPTIVRAKNGDLLAFAEGRKKATSDNGDIDIVLKRSSDGGKSWGRMQLVQDEPGDPAAKVWIGNPTPIVDRTDPMHPGRIWLVFTRSNERMFVTFSDDNGKSWAERRDITETAGKPAWRWYAAGPVHGIQLERGPHAGRLVAPCDHRMRGADSWGAHLIYSDDHGATWKLGATDTHLVADPGTPERVRGRRTRRWAHIRECAGSERLGS